MFSPAFNITAGCFSPADCHHPAQQQETTYSDILFSGHDSSISGCLFHYPNPLALVIHDVAEDDHVPTVCSTVIASCSIEKTPIPAESVGVVASKKSYNRSKIRTAQGLRDRRVRLSIGTARKFFDLQDLLGFDRPSGTLEWLLKKSNKAILKLSAASSSSKTSSEAASRRVDATYSSNQAEGMSCDVSLKTMKKEKVFLAKESRAKARARARARTVAKLCKAKINYQQIQLLKNQEGKMISRGNQKSYPNPNCHNVYSWPSSTKSLVILESHIEDRKLQGEEHQLHEQKQHLMLHNHDSGIESYCWSGLNPNSSLDHWDICNVFPQPSASLAHHLNLSSRDIDTKHYW